MSEEIKKEMQGAELNLDELSQVAGSMDLNDTELFGDRYFEK